MITNSSHWYQSSVLTTNTSEVTIVNNDRGNNNSYQSITHSRQIYHQQNLTVWETQTAALTFHISRYHVAKITDRITQAIPATVKSAAVTVQVHLLPHVNAQLKCHSTNSILYHIETSATLLNSSEKPQMSK